MKHRKVRPTVGVSPDVYAELVKYSQSVRVKMSMIVDIMISEYLASGKNILHEREPTEAEG